SKVEDLFRNWPSAPNAMAVVEVAPPGTPERQTTADRPGVPDPAGFGEDQPTIPDPGGFPGDGPTIAGAGPAPFTGTDQDPGVPPLEPTTWARPGWQVWVWTAVAVLVSIPLAIMAFTSSPLRVRTTVPVAPEGLLTPPAQPS
ncbi:MAG TPA: hypothetical protein VKG45_08485, partial [Actinomycetes bacterium]|nr:hypothetical protein [Actinomycetes bacterium]